MVPTLSCWITNDAPASSSTHKWRNGSYFYGRQHIARVTVSFFVSVEESHRFWRGNDILNNSGAAEVSLHRLRHLSGCLWHNKCIVLVIYCFVHCYTAINPSVYDIIVKINSVWLVVRDWLSGWLLSWISNIVSKIHEEQSWDRAASEKMHKISINNKRWTRLYHAKRRESCWQTVRQGFSHVTQFWSSCIILIYR